MEASTTSPQLRPASFTLLLALIISLSINPSAEESSGEQQVHVKTTSGRLMGLRENLTGLEEAQVVKFLGVPYAAAPVGPLRFRRPEPLQTPSALRDSSRFGKTCPQHRHLGQFMSPLLDLDSKHETSEDCLQLNLFVPRAALEASHAQPLPVIVWIPGEGFDFADARQFDGSYLAAKTHSLVVTVQYRVGVLGFLSAPALGIPGNMGLHDQLEALRWLQRNLARFGGDPDRVTLMGRFSGSMAISALLSAPNQQLLRSADGQRLFSKAALLSGIAVADWIIDNNQQERLPKLLESARKEKLCAPEMDQLECLVKMPAQELLRISEYGWRLVADGELVGASAPAEAVRERAPEGLEEVLIGETGQEGSLCLFRHLLQTRTNNYAQLIDEDRLTAGALNEIIADDLATYFRYNASQAAPLRAALESALEPSEGRSRESYLNACSAFMVKSHARRFKRNLLVNSAERRDSARRQLRVHHYELRYKPSFSLAPDYIETAAHGDDIPLIFGLVYKQREAADPKDLLMSNKMMNLVGAFARGQARQSGRRSWRPESNLQQIDFEERDSEQLSRKTAELAEQPQDLAVRPRGNLKMILLQSSAAQAPEALRLQPLLELLEQQRPEERALESGARAQRLAELYRQSLEEGVWARREPPSPQQQLRQSSLLNESSFLTLMVFCSCVVIMAVLSLFIGFSLILFRNNLASSGKSLHQFAGPAGQCNICDDSHPDPIESVLGAGRKEARVGFGNVFAKLRNQNNPQSAGAQPQSSSAAAEPAGAH